MLEQQITPTLALLSHAARVLREDEAICSSTARLMERGFKGYDAPECCNTVALTLQEEGWEFLVPEHSASRLPIPAWWIGY